jgi:hypothetical protein
VEGKSLTECNTGKVAVNIRVLEKANTQFTLAFYNRYTERRLNDFSVFGGIAQALQLPQFEAST